jgi:hypothetical protein
MSTIQRVYGAGLALFGTILADVCFRYEYYPADTGDIPTDELWTVRVDWNDFDALGIRRNEPFRLYILGHPPAHVQLRRSWTQTPYVWLELERADSRAPGDLLSGLSITLPSPA